MAIVVASAVTARRGLRICLWLLQIALACLFTFTGWMKVSTPLDVLAAQMPWVRSAPLLVRFIGVCELAGALGLVLPAGLRIAPRLTGTAAAGLATIMVLAMGFHLFRGELRMFPVPLVLFLLCAFVAWGRLVAAPIEPRSLEPGRRAAV